MTPVLRSQAENQNFGQSTKQGLSEVHTRVSQHQISRRGGQGKKEILFKKANDQTDTWLGHMSVI